LNAVHQPSSVIPRAPGLRRALEALATRRITVSGLIEQALDAAEASKRDLHAFAAIDWDGALSAAAESERRYAQGRQRPLEGLAIGVKDLIDTRGIETSYGSAAYLGHLPTFDADIVRALIERGAIPIGKTTTHEFAWGVTTASATFGDALNPLDRTRIPGGSSGGAAAAIAYGAVAAGLGTDTGGSVRGRRLQADLRRTAHARHLSAGPDAGPSRFSWRDGRRHRDACGRLPHRGAAERRTSARSPGRRPRDRARAVERRGRGCIRRRCRKARRGLRLHDGR
jgi:hypothetical protein